MPHKPNRAPLVVFGGMIAIAVTGLLAVFINDCRRDEPYLDPVEIKPGEEGRVPPPLPKSP